MGPTQNRDRNQVPTQQRDRNHAPTQHRDRNQVPTQNRDRNQAPTQHRDRNQVHTQHRDRNQVPTQHRDRNQVPAQHGDRNRIPVAQNMDRSTSGLDRTRSPDTQHNRQEAKSHQSVQHLLHKRPNLHFESAAVPLVQPSQERVPVALPSPTYGSPEPLITHIGAPLPPGASQPDSAPSHREFSDTKQPAIQFE